MFASSSVADVVFRGVRANDSHRWPAVHDEEKNDDH